MPVTLSRANLPARMCGRAEGLAKGGAISPHMLSVAKFPYYRSQAEYVVVSVRFATEEADDEKEGAACWNASRACRIGPNRWQAT